MGFFKRFTKPKTSVSLTIPKSTFELGEDLKGAIAVSSQEEFDATEVRAELRCIEKKKKEKWEYDPNLRREVHRVYWDQATLHSADPKASGSLHLVPGFKRRFPSVSTFLLVDESLLQGWMQALLGPLKELLPLKDALTSPAKR